MNTRTLLIAIACGLGSAIMLFSPTQFGLLGAFLAYLSLVPIFISVLGFGTSAGIVSAIVTALVFALTSGALSGLLAFLVHIFPAVWIGHSAGLAQQTEDGTEWFPLSQILMRLAIMSVSVSILLFYMLGINPEQFAQSVQTAATEFYANFAAQNSGFVVPDEAQISAQADRAAGFMPLAVPASMLLMYILNLAIGSRISRARGWMLRPKDFIPEAAALPVYAVFVFALALGLSMLGGPIGLFGKVLAGGFGCAFMLVGMSLMHFFTRGFSGRRLLLYLTYLTTIILLFPTFLFVMMGLAETLLGLRARRSSSTTN